MKKLIVAGFAVLAITGLAAPAQADTGGDHYRGVKCYENYRWIKDLTVIRPHGSRCATARKVMRRWYDHCPLEGECKIRIGYYGTLWSCWTNRQYMRVRPHFATCSSGRSNRQFTSFLYTG